MRRVRPLLFALSILLPLVVCARAARADGEVFFSYPPRSAPAYAIVSVPDAFSWDLERGTGSPTILVRIGIFQGGPTIPQSRFFRDAPPTIPLPIEFTFPDLEGNALTIVGAFETALPVPTAHMVTPNPVGILPDIQAAFYAATRAGALDALVSNPFEPVFPSTYDIASAICEFLPGGTARVQEVATALFTSSMTLHLGEGLVATVAAEDDLFPHPKDAPALFHVGISVDEDGNFAVDVCRLESVEVKEQSIDLTKQGQLPVTIYGTDDFDVRDVDVTTIQIGGVFAVKANVAGGKLVCHFSVPELVAAGVLGSTTTEVTLTADLEDGSCIQGTSAVHVK